MELESLVMPQANAAEEAGKLIMNLPKLWIEANPDERRKLLLSMLDAVYVDAKEEKRIVAIKPKPPFIPVFHVATTKERSGVILLKEPLADFPEAPCLWWRRGRVELPVQGNLLKTYYKLS
jgi:site-specific DNA recombinase